MSNVAPEGRYTGDPAADPRDPRHHGALATGRDHALSGTHTARVWTHLARINRLPGGNKGRAVAAILGPSTSLVALAVAALADAEEEITVAQVARLTGLSVSAAGGGLRRLVDSDWITRHGQPRGRYVLCC